MRKRISKKEASQKYGILTGGMNMFYRYYLLDNGDVVDSDGDFRFIKDNVHKQKRLDYLRGQIEKECISYSEIAELQSLASYIQKDDVELLDWAGVKEN
jgi:hypothetical protein